MSARKDQTGGRQADQRKRGERSEGYKGLLKILGLLLFWVGRIRNFVVRKLLASKYIEGGLAIGLTGGDCLTRALKGKVGRPKAASTLGKTVKIRLSDAELASVKAAAGEAGMTVSAFVRSLSLEGAGVRPIFNDSDRAALSILYENMRKIGVNLNQVTRAINSGRAVHPEEVLIALRNVELIATGVAVELRNSARRAGNARRET